MAVGRGWVGAELCGSGVPGGTLFTDNQVVYHQREHFASIGNSFCADKLQIPMTWQAHLSKNIFYSHLPL